MSQSQDHDVNDSNQNDVKDENQNNDQDKDKKIEQLMFQNHKLRQLCKALNELNNSTKISLDIVRKQNLNLQKQLIDAVMSFLIMLYNQHSSQNISTIVIVLDHCIIEGESRRC